MTDALPLHNAILTELGTGRAHSLSRDELRLRVGHWLEREVSDRELREAIEWLRQNDAQGALIVSDSGWAGYWFAEDYAEVLACYEQERHRALKLMVRIRKQRDLAAQQFQILQAQPQRATAQLELFDVAVG